MSLDHLERVKYTPEYERLVRTRRRVVWPLAIIMMVAYYAYILLIAFVPDILAIKIGDGPTTTGILAGLGVIFFSFLLTGIYVQIANKTLEPITEDLHDKVKQSSDDTNRTDDHAE